jgi:peroxiredoxin
MKTSIFMCALNLIFVLLSPDAMAMSTKIEGPKIPDMKTVVVEPAQKGMVVVFLSAVCPCSNSHLTELKNLKEKFADFNFVGIHSNVDEGKELTVNYFKNANLPFPVIQDTKAKIANDFKAFKTPHAYIILKDGSIAYQGGVSDSHEFNSSKQKYLREALEDLSKGQKVKTPEGRTL